MLTTPARKTYFLLINIAIVIQLSYLHARPKTSDPQETTINHLLEGLKAHRGCSKQVSAEEMRVITQEAEKIAQKIASARPEDISAALPAIIRSISEGDEETKVCANIALLDVTFRPDSGVLLREYIGTIGTVLNNSADERLQRGAGFILSSLRPQPPRDVVQPLLLFLRRSDRNPQLQSAAVSILLKIAPDDPQVIAGIQEFWSRSLDNTTRQNVLNALGNAKARDPRIIQIVINAVDDPDLRFTTVQVADRLGPEVTQRAQPAMLRAFASYIELLKRANDDLNQQISALNILAHYDLQAPEAEAAMRDFLARPMPPQHRVGALNSLRIPHLNNRDLIASVTASLDDADQNVRLTAIKVLVDIGPNAVLQAQPVLRELAERPGEPHTIKTAAKEALQIVPAR